MTMKFALFTANFGHKEYVGRLVTFKLQIPNILECVRANTFENV